MREKLGKKFIKIFLIYQISLLILALMAVGENNKLALVSYAQETSQETVIQTIKEIEATDVPTTNDDYEISYLFKFSGLPKDVKYEGYKTIKISFDFIGQFIAFLITLVINVIKLAIIGWVIIFENIIKNIMDSVTGAVVEEPTPSPSPSPSPSTSP